MASSGRHQSATGHQRRADYLGCRCAEPGPATSPACMDDGAGCERPDHFHRRASPVSARLAEGVSRRSVLPAQHGVRGAGRPSRRFADHTAVAAARSASRFEGVSPELQAPKRGVHRILCQATFDRRVRRFGIACFQLGFCQERDELHVVRAGGRGLIQPFDRGVGVVEPQ